MKINLLDCFEKTVQSKKNEIAVIHKEENITFMNIQKSAKKLANVLLDKIGDKINSPIAVFLPKEINTVIADIGIMYSCNPFMNLDIKTPKDRIANIIEMIKPIAIVTSSKFEGKLCELNIPIILLDELEFVESVDEKILENRRSMLIDTDPFCIINT